jgi:hypothetical protein
VGSVVLSAGGGPSEVLATRAPWTPGRDAARLARALAAMLGQALMARTQAQAGVSGVRWWLVAPHLDTDYTDIYGVFPLPSSRFPGSIARVAR